MTSRAFVFAGLIGIAALGCARATFHDIDGGAGDGGKGGTTGTGGRGGGGDAGNGGTGGDDGGTGVTPGGRGCSPIGGELPGSLPGSLPGPSFGGGIRPLSWWKWPIASEKRHTSPRIARVSFGAVSGI